MPAWGVWVPSDSGPEIKKRLCLVRTMLCDLSALWDGLCPSLCLSSDLECFVLITFQILYLARGTSVCCSFLHRMMLVLWMVLTQAWVCCKII